ncbi:capsule polysaccharide export ABC transporter transmembrane protein [Caballeronia glebae]|uniref:Capsule polysaccharide export ABC transporter transmembrane protein n=2 Tax=Caballeronia glebae TaxID=1777143 RepID=A0A158DF68_9BURK|nr:capsule polysaccharide export ABC transporter transmembrane protein [Caballeronia glebae]
MSVIIAPVFLSLIYATFIAVPRYTADSRFSVRSSSGMPTGGVTSLLATGDGSGIAGGFVDGWAVSDFLSSRDCMQRLDKKIDLRSRLAYTGLDLVNRLAPNANEDDLFRAYRAAVKVSYNMMEQVDVMTISAFSARDAAAISEALLDIAQDFVNRMDEKGLADALKISRQAVTMAEREAKGARAQLADWRVQHGNIDPSADAAMLLGLVAQIETELNAARITLDKVRALNNPDHPMLRPATEQVAALQKRLGETRRRMSGQGKTEASLIREYEELKNAQTFADSNLQAAQQNYQQAFTGSLRLQRYLSVIAKPLSSELPTSPRKSLLMLEALACGFALALVLRIGKSSLRELRHG